MPHPYKVTVPRKSPVNPLDPELPLINLTVSHSFAAIRKGKAHGGRIHPQRMSKDSVTAHPSLFYIEFPAESADYREVSIPKLCAILGEGGGSTFTLAQAARILSSIPRSHDFTNLIKAASP